MPDATSVDVDLDRLCIDTIRTLCIDAIEAAGSGHPGTPIGIAPVTYTLWQRFLRFDPADPIWPNRDRFVLSAGHASMLLWSLLHLTGVRAVDPDYEVLGQPAVSLDDLKRFRQLDSKCPGHPEYRWTSGVETTTGPLGQGVATSVGMAIAGQWLAARYNRDGFTLFDFDVYAQAGDGCMMEGVSSEAASLAAHDRLSNLCWIYDSNRVTIEGHTDLAFTEDVAARFTAYGWNVTTVADANDVDQAARAFHDFRSEHERPTLVVVHSHIGYGTPVEDTPKAHGEPLGPEGVKATKRFLGWPEDAQFLVPEGVYERFADGIGERGREAREAWEAMFGAYRAEHPELADEIERMQRRELPDGWDAELPSFPPDPAGLATRDSSGQVLNAAARRIPWLLGGSADLSPSTKTRLVFDGAGDFGPDDRTGRNLHFGVREFASAAIANGLALVKVRPFWSGFLIFSDYARGRDQALGAHGDPRAPRLHARLDRRGRGRADAPAGRAARLAAGDARPPRLPPGGRERGGGDVALRPPAPPRARGARPLPAGAADARPVDPRAGRGGDEGRVRPRRRGDGDPDVLLIATGSEVSLALSAREELAADGIGARVVSMPCSELFDRQPQGYRDEVLPPSLRARVAIEQASSLGWHRYVGDGGAIVAMNTFGASAPLKQLVERFGFTPDAVSRVAREVVAQ